MSQEPSETEMRYRGVKPQEGHWSEEQTLDADPLVMLPIEAPQTSTTAQSSPTHHNPTQHVEPEKTTPSVAPPESLAVGSEAPKADVSVAIVGPPSVGKTYFCKGLVKLFVRENKTLRLPVENLFPEIRLKLSESNHQLLSPEEFLKSLDKGIRESATAPAMGLNLHELLLRWGKRDSHQQGSISILLNDTAGEHLEGKSSQAALCDYISQAEHLWLLIPSWTLSQTGDTEQNGQLRSPREMREKFGHEVEWLQRLIEGKDRERDKKRRRFHILWTMSNDPITREWLKSKQLLDDWQRSKSVSVTNPLSLARFVSFQRTIHQFVEQHIAQESSLEYLRIHLAKLRYVGSVQHSMINVIDDLAVEGQSYGSRAVREAPMHIEAPILSLLSTQLRFAQ